MLGLDLPYDLPCLQDIVKFAEKKIKRIPLEVMHSVHTTMLYNLEALQEVVQWERILKLLSRDGSFLSSPASTAVAYMKTGDKKCLEFLTFVVNRFGDNAPCQYPIDLLERIWAIDTIQRLGIDHHFRKEIYDTLDYVYRNAGKQGVSWGRDNPVPDIDDTCMALRLMRLQGFPVSSDVLEYFKDDDGTLICFPGQTHRGVSDMFNLYRYSQVAFPGEKILKEAKAFAEEYLKNCVENNEVNDKWSLKKALDKEVDQALKVPWRMSFERLEAREYIDQYGELDVWIAKTIYWMYNVNDPKYMELAKLDYNKLQTLYKAEIDSILKWWNSCGFDDPLVGNACPRETHFAIAATLYEPEFSHSRVAYTKCNCIENTLRDLFESHESVEELKVMCLAVEKWDPSMVRSLPSIVKATFMGMYDTTNELSAQISNARRKEMFPYLHDLRVKQIKHYMKKRETSGEPYIGSLEEYIDQNKADLGVAIRVLPAMFLIGECIQYYALRCLDEKSTIQDHLSSYLTIFVDLQTHKVNQGEGRSDAVTIYMEEEDCSEEEALRSLNAIMENTFDELVHDYLKPSLVPRGCRRLMFEHARIVQYLHSDEYKAIDSDMERMFTPVQ
uniref:Uncharacterized protein n=1 Tax=Ananas comosus var. bracteatus TaxID=296719 RepID=A0A6V7Q5K9_ANACO|nr:unnamed protein product [Ananas comosus var. bracteatus]